MTFYVWELDHINGQVFRYGPFVDREDADSAVEEKQDYANDFSASYVVTDSETFIEVQND